MKKWLPSLLLLAPNLAWACPVCGTAPARSQSAYVWMTAMMTVLPLAVIGTLVFLLFRRLRAHEAERPTPASPPSAEPMVLGDPTLPRTS